MRRVLVVVLVFGVLFLAQTLRADSIFMATLDGAQEPTASTATGFGMVILNTAQTMITVDENWTGLIGGPATVSHIHCLLRAARLQCCSTVPLHWRAERDVGLYSRADICDHPCAGSRT